MAACASLLCTTLALGQAQAQNRDEERPPEEDPEQEVKAAPLENSPVGNPEFGPRTPVPAPTQDQKLTTKFTLSSEIHAFENLDMRKLDEVSDQEILNSDDRHTFAYSSISAQLGYQIRKDLSLKLGVSHNGLWAEDQLGSEAQFVGALYFSDLNFTWTPVQSDAMDLSLTMGRQGFRIGGVPTDYMLDDLLDAVTLTADLKDFGRLRWLAVDFFQANDLPNAAFVRYVSGRQPTLGLRGDTYTLRTGLAYDIDLMNFLGGGAPEDSLELEAPSNPNSLVLTGYWFYADIGGGPIDESGADVSYGGSLGNFSDNDYTHMYGARAMYTLDTDGFDLVAFGEFAQSAGIDRKEVVARDVETVGSAFGGGLDVKVNVMEGTNLRLLADLYSFDGATYAGDGLEFERGFVSFRGRRMGGLAINRYAGWLPSAALGRGGVDHAPNNLFRAAGLQSLHAGLGFESPYLDLRGDVWLYSDTSSSFLNLAELDDLDPPFGYSREEFYATTARAGKALGSELNLQAIVHANENLDFYGAYGAFLPGEYYEIEIDRVADADNPGTTAQGAADPQTFWAITGGARINF
jgi:hypothetical protein